MFEFLTFSKIETKLLDHDRQLDQHNKNLSSLNSVPPVQIS